MDGCLPTHTSLISKTNALAVGWRTLRAVAEGSRAQMFGQGLTGTLHFGNFDKNFRFYTYVGITKGIVEGAPVLFWLRSCCSPLSLTEEEDA